MDNPTLRPGAYLRILTEGELGAGDAIRLLEKPDHGLTVRDVFRIFVRDRHEVGRLLEIPQISESWKGWAEARLQKAQGNSGESDSPGCC